MQTLWIARDEDGDLYLYLQKPALDKKDGEYGSFYIEDDPIDHHRFKKLDNDSYPEVTFQNSPQRLIPEFLKTNNP